ncbi:DUF6612 family protein [Salirhabdus salicampi]|uniref:DUF6612 family protein n=1 Tax=Salirhabdus salicampi TaxID=476102 RepID=UPI0020C3E360|nr:DUF6612 family protein [Salirhabdus salicampi]MCP8617622.1 hypothetical protein [Salirhabdus salicampi]
MRFPFYVFFIISLLLTACSQDERADNEHESAEQQPATTENNATNEETKQNDNVRNNPNELFSKMVLAMQKQNSYITESSLSIEVSGNEDGTMEMESTSEIVLDPFQSHVSTTLTTTGDGENVSVHMETYNTPDGSYSFNSMFGSWIFSESDQHHIFDKLSPGDFYESLVTLEEEIDIEEQDEQMIVLAGGNIQDIHRFFHSMPIDGSENLPESNVDIVTASMKGVIHKDSLLLESLSWQLELVGEDENLSANYTFTLNVKDYNTINEIKVPDDIIEEAMEESN